jgi:hypothetical protein
VGNKCGFIPTPSKAVFLLSKLSTMDKVCHHPTCSLRLLGLIPEKHYALFNCDDCGEDFGALYQAKNTEVMDCGFRPVKDDVEGTIGDSAV